MLLNVEQKKLINLKPNGHNLIKGVAGSGKTTVAIQRIPFLLNHYCEGKEDSILMVTFNKTLVNYIEYLYKKVESNEQISFHNLLNEKAKNENKVEIINIDRILYRYFIDNMKGNHLNLKIVSDNRIIHSSLRKAINTVKKNYPGEKILNEDHLQFIQGEIEWIKSCNYCELSEYMNVDRVGRATTNNMNHPSKLRKNSPIREALYEVMIVHKENLLNQGYVDMKDMNLYALQQAKKSPKKKYTHIIVDESQDLTKVQLDFLRCLYKDEEYSSITFVADIAQNIYPHSWLVKGRSFSTIGFDMKGKSNILSKNYRTTTQIAECAYSLVKEDVNIIEDENYVEPSLIDRQGAYPLYKAFNSPEEEVKYIIEIIKGNLLKKYQMKDIAIIAKFKNMFNNYEKIFKENNLEATMINGDKNAFEENSIKLITMHSIKGLEFKVVFIVGLNKGVIPFLSNNEVSDIEYQKSIERKILYVGMTRANELLYLTSNAVPSEFVSDINPKYLKSKEESKFSVFYSVNVKNYLFKKEIYDLFSKEEKVRQWVIKELMDNYNYPEELIEIEYNVNCFSKTGLVDIAVHIYDGKDKIPFIFIETKAANLGINTAKAQLISYMSNNLSVKYGIATDGNDLIIIDKEGKSIKDIPTFNSSMMRSTLESIKFSYSNNEANYEILRDNSISKEITVISHGESINYNENQLININCYGSIAAGIPIHMNETIENSFFIPKQWISESKEYFILKVKGDSMIDANINSGDYVLLQSQITAENRQIVAVSQDGCATLKRYIKMGSTVLLMPENPAYEPIQITSDEARILGVMVGKFEWSK
ncbi:S24 family peptidase [Clostridium grantii]|uniref:DNA 3'-5' helicase n=1 Tax=Clostridium grantii DSM 8605 TaxID=1121316 RepID=A0A1M5XMF9_9CLOT|nr:S24 family peptidase [Clostridium grantii]SHI00714.1 SOS regulatory protein LexA [Clostridium grantii DSM 8605]